VAFVGGHRALPMVKPIGFGRFEVCIMSHREISNSIKGAAIKNSCKARQTSAIQQELETRSSRNPLSFDLYTA